MALAVLVVDLMDLLPMEADFMDIALWFAAEPSSAETSAILSPFCRAFESQNHPLKPTKSSEVRT